MLSAEDLQLTAQLGTWVDWSQKGDSAKTLQMPANTYLSSD